MNKVVLIGRTTKQVDLQYVGQQQQPRARFTLAITRRYKNGDGMSETDFIQCVAWGKTAENMSIYCGKGSLVAVSGRLRSDSYMNAQQQRVYVTEVVAKEVEFLVTKKDEDSLKDFQPINSVQAPF